MTQSVRLSVGLLVYHFLKAEFTNFHPRVMEIYVNNWVSGL